MTESARKNAEGAPIEHVEHLRSEIVWGGNTEDKHAIDLQIIM